MNLGDKIKNKAQEMTGKAKESAGESTGNPELKREGERDQAGAGFRQAGEHAKDALSDVKDGMDRH